MKIAIHNSYMISAVVVGIFIAGLLSIDFAKGQANNTPTITSTTISYSSQGPSESSIILLEAITTDIYIYGEAVDLDSCEEIDDVGGASSTWKVAFYRTDVTGADTCTPDDARCYQPVEVNADLSGCTGPQDTTINYEFVIPVQYFADATDAGSAPNHADTNWTAYVYVEDDQAASTNNTVTAEMATTNAIDISANLDYGSLEIAGISAEKTITVTNTGNYNNLDVLIKDANGWTCDRGTVASAQLHWNDTPSQLYASGTPVTTTPVSAIQIPKTTTTASSTGNVYVQMKVPDGGVAGTCNGTLSFISS